MKRLRFLPILCVLVAAALSAETIDTRRHIEVDATAKILVGVDRAVWDIKIRGEAGSLVEASRLLESSVTALRQRLKDDAGLPPDVLRLSGITSGKAYENDEATKVFKGFYAERAAGVELADLEQRQALETALLADDRIEIVKVNLRSSRHEESRREALLAAVSAAKSKASFLAREAGAELGPVLAIKETSAGSGWGFITSNMISEFRGEEAPSAEFEKLQYSATITMKFGLQ